MGGPDRRLSGRRCDFIGEEVDFLQSGFRDGRVQNRPDPLIGPCASDMEGITFVFDPAFNTVGLIVFVSIGRISFLSSSGNLSKTSLVKVGN